MNDRELLELAAKAAGIPLKPDFVDRFDYYMAAPLMWNPLTDDGDALRLAVKLGIALDCTKNRCWAYSAGRAMGGVCEEFYKYDPYAATRRAIVRAAAEIGRMTR